MEQTEDWSGSKRAINDRFLTVAQTSQAFYRTVQP